MFPQRRVRMRGGDEGEYLRRAVKAGEDFAALAAKYR
jgi:hypothetical protein